jgi:dienelactone hydrolase
MSELRRQLAERVGFTRPASAADVVVLGSQAADGDVGQLIEYESADGDVIRSFLLLPEGDGPFPAVVVHHQHHREWHLGKSEVAGLAGDPRQQFGPALAARGLAVLAPDSICFEDRRRTGPGTDPRDDDWLQHYTEMSHRLARGEPLMGKVLTDAAAAVSALAAIEQIDASRIGALGHSYGGNTVLFHAALDERIAFACASGAACTYRAKLAHGTPIEMAEAIPGILEVADVDRIAGLIPPRRLLLVSAAGDPYSRDADAVAAADSRISHLRFDGGHALDDERFAAITDWIVDQALARRGERGAAPSSHSDRESSPQS